MLDAKTARVRESGQDLVEYGIVIALVAVIGIASLVVVGRRVESVVSQIVPREQVNSVRCNQASSTRYTVVCHPRR